MRLAGIAGAKRTSELIPLCHPLPIDAVSVEVESTDEWGQDHCFGCHDRPDRGGDGGHDGRLGRRPDAL